MVRAGPISDANLCSQEATEAAEGFLIRSGAWRYLRMVAARRIDLSIAGLSRD